MKKRFVFLVLAVGCYSVGLAHAEIADRTMPTHIEADNMQHNELKKITTATGRVIVTKGSIVLRANKVEVRQDTQGNQLMTATAKTGEVVFMRQKREGLNEFIEARASKIERDEKNLIARLIGNASMQRLAGDTLMDSIHGDILIYNEVTETYQVQADRTKTKPSVSGIPAGRVRATIGARAETAKLTKANNSNTTQNTPRNRMQLRPSTSIGDTQ